MSNTSVIRLSSGLLGTDVFPLPTDLAKIQQSQIFGVYGKFIPTKSSVYIRPSGESSSAYITISEETAIDALNFLDLSQKTNKIFPSTSFSGYSGHASLAVEEFDSVADYAILEYPIKVSAIGDYTFFFRCKTLNNPFSMEIYFDDVSVDIINTNIADLVDWNWFYITVTIPDTEVHTLGISLLQKESAIDKIVVSDAPITALGSNNYVNSYITLHSMLYTVTSGDEPDDPLFVYDYKTTAREIKTDDWYNFDLNFLDSSRSISFDDRYALVMFASGSSQSKYLVWELSDADAYLDMPSCVKA